MRVLAAYGLQFGRYRITQMAKQKKNNMITQRHILGCLAWRPPGRSWYGASGGGPLVAAMGAWRTFTGYSDHKDGIGCNNINHKDVIVAVAVWIIEM